MSKLSKKIEFSAIFTFCANLFNTHVITTLFSDLKFLKKLPREKGKFSRLLNYVLCNEPSAEILFESTDVTYIFFQLALVLKMRKWAFSPK